MITKKQKEEITKDCIKYFKKAKIAITKDEKNNKKIKINLSSQIRNPL